MRSVALAGVLLLGCLTPFPDPIESTGRAGAADAGIRVEGALDATAAPGVVDIGTVGFADVYSDTGTADSTADVYTPDAVDGELVAFDATVDAGQLHVHPGDVVASATPLRAALRLVPAGGYWMGDATGEGEPDELSPSGDLTWVEISALWVAETETTQRMWIGVVGNQPAHFVGCGATCPVERVSWYDAVAYCNALSVAEGLTEAYQIRDQDVQWDVSADGYRLLTEAEWEYAARAGNNGEVPVDQLNSTSWHSANAEATYDGAYDCAVIGHNLFAGCGPQPVGTLDPNVWGLFDMLGSVAEWTFDGYQDRYPGGHLQDPVVHAPSDLRVVRGGGWGTPRPRFADRRALAPSISGVSVGFRVARSVLPVSGRR